MNSNSSKLLKLISIDIGITNLAFVEAEISYEQFEQNSFNQLERKSFFDKNNKKSNIHCLSIDKITKCHLVNIKDITEYCSRKNCKLYHDNSICDYVSHFFQEYETVLEEADIILIERQPITGLTAVQELINYRYRGKTDIISPRAMHKYFQIPQIKNNCKHNILDDDDDYSDDILEIESQRLKQKNYFLRKETTIKIAENYINYFSSEIFNDTERQHDIADAICLLIYWIFRENEILDEKRYKNSGFSMKLRNMAYKEQI